MLNVSIDLGVHGRDAAPRPPVEAYLRVIDEPVLRLVSVDLGATRRHHRPGRGLRFRQGLPRPAEGGGHRRRHRAAGHRRLRRRASPTCWPASSGPGRGLELVSQRQRHPQGLAPGRLHQPAGRADRRLHARHRPGRSRSPARCRKHERRLVAARAILGEWLGGSGGGWQDSGGVWPGMKLIEGVLAGEGDPEFGISRGRLLPDHSHPRPRRRLAGDARRRCRTAWCWSTAAWRRTSARSWRW